jgi:hypothetical protein
MIYLRHIHESLDDKKYLEELKSLPYSTFMTRIAEKVKSEKFQNSLSGLEIADSVNEDYGKVKNKDLVASQLIPTQSQIGIIETLSWSDDTEAIDDIVIDGKATLFDRNRIFVANNKWILDGHHRWAYVYMLNPESSIPVININLPDRKPIDILKDIQLCVAATYKTIYDRKEQILPVKLDDETNSGNISQMTDESIRNTISQSLDDSVVMSLRNAYGSTDLKKFIIKQFLPKGLVDPNTPLLEQRFIQSNDYTNTTKIKTNLSKSKRIEKQPISTQFQKLIDTDKENETKLGGIIEDQLADKIQNVVDIIGIFDPTPTANTLNAVGYIYRGEWIKAFIQLIAILPIGEVLARPLMSLMKNRVIAKLGSKFATYLLRLSETGMAKIIKEIEEYELKKMGGTLFSKLFKAIFENLGKFVKILAPVVGKIGPHYPKFVVFYNMLSSLPSFFSKVQEIKSGVAEELNTSSDGEVFDILSSNVVRIKRLIVDRGVDKYNINFSRGVQPLQTALLAKTNPYTSEFKGVPTSLLSNIPTMMKKLKSIESVEEVQEEQPKDRKVSGFQDFKDKIYPQTQTDKSAPETKIEQPEEIIADVEDKKEADIKKKVVNKKSSEKNLQSDRSQKTTTKVAV